MSVTATLMDGPGVVDGLGVVTTWKVLMDTSFLTAGEPIDFTDYYSEISCAIISGVDAVADAQYSYQVVLPSDGTAITSSNVLISAYESPAKTGTGDFVVEAFSSVATGTDLSSIGELRITVIGKAIT